MYEYKYIAYVSHLLVGNSHFNLCALLGNSFIPNFF